MDESLRAQLMSLGVLWSAASQPWESLLCLFLMPHFSLSFSLTEGDHEFDHFSTAQTPSPSQPAAEDPWWEMMLMARAQTILLHCCSPIYSSKMSQFHRQWHRDAAGLTCLRNPFLVINTPCEIIIFYSFLWVILHKDKQNSKQTNKQA